MDSFIAAEPRRRESTATNHAVQVKALLLPSSALLPCCRKIQKCTLKKKVALRVYLHAWRGDFFLLFNITTYFFVHVHSQADYYAYPIPSLRFWSGRKNKTLSCKIETGFLCGDGARVIRFFARVIQQLGFWTQKIQANVDYCYVRRRAKRTSLGPELEHPSLYAQTLVWPRRDVPRRFTWYFFQPSTRAQHHELLLCVYSRMIRKTRMTRAACAALLVL